MYRERKRESIQQEINFICKSFRLCLYQLRNGNRTIKYCCSCQFTKIFFTNFYFSLLHKSEYQYKKTDKKIVVTKLKEIRLTMTNHNLVKSN